MQMIYGPTFISWIFVDKFRLWRTYCALQTYGLLVQISTWHSSQWNLEFDCRAVLKLLPNHVYKIVLYGSRAGYPSVLLERCGRRCSFIWIKDGWIYQDTGWRWEKRIRRYKSTHSILRTGAFFKLLIKRVAEEWLRIEIMKLDKSIIF